MDREVVPLADVGAAWNVAARATELAEARGLLEAQAWNLYGVVELGLLTGEWDRAVDAALRAIDLGERNAYHRPVVRSWFAVLPIGTARGDETLDRAAVQPGETRELVVVCQVELRDDE